mgnify:CR=1 FL=1
MGLCTLAINIVTGTCIASGTLKAANEIQRFLYSLNLKQVQGLLEISLSVGVIPNTYTSTQFLTIFLSLYSQRVQ